MVRVGGFLKSQNRIRRQRARGRYISPYQVGGTIFGKSTTARYPLMYTSSRLTDPLHRVRPARKMKGGTVFGTSTRMRRGNPMQVLAADQDKARQRRWLQQRMIGKGDLRQILWANQAKARKQRMKGGGLFSKLKKRIQIDFPHRPFPSAFPIQDLNRLRKGIKRGRR